MNKLTAITMALLLASCSDGSSNEALSFPEDMHANDRAIATTAEYDDPSDDSSFAGPWGVKVFSDRN